MAQKCEYAERNNYGKIICTVDENRLCSFQRYCSKENEWQNSKAFSTCERRLGMSKSNKNKKDSILVEDNKKVVEKVNVEDLNINEVDNIQFVNIEENDVKNNINEVKEDVIKKRKGKVILTSSVSIIVVDEENHGFTLYNRPNAKVGDIIEF